MTSSQMFKSPQKALKPKSRGESSRKNLHPPLKSGWRGVGRQTGTQHHIQIRFPHEKARSKAQNCQPWSFHPGVTTQRSAGSTCRPPGPFSVSHGA